MRPVTVRPLPPFDVVALLLIERAAIMLKAER
jgi:hypothetical protein